MRIVNYIGLLCLCLSGCYNPNSKTVIKPQKLKTLVGEWDNFLQVWLENTETDMHRMTVTEKHRHYSLSITTDEEDENNLIMEIREGRNGKDFVDRKTFLKDELLANESVRLHGDTLFISGFDHFNHGENAYAFIRPRMFSGWIQYPVKQYKDSVYFQRDLTLHDQGGLVELDIDGVDYTVELTQLVYGKRIRLMKIAIYDMPLDSVEINSRSVSYAWTSPEAKRLGINLRHIVSGWTLIEPEYLNSNTMKQED